MTLPEPLVSLISAHPHCATCTCRPPVPDTFVSEVRFLPFDLDYMAQETVGRGRAAEIREYRALDWVFWEPDFRQTLSQRIRYYRRLLNEGTCRNIREAVKMVAAKRREWVAEETRCHAEWLRTGTRPQSKFDFQTLDVNKKHVRSLGLPCRYCGTPNARSVDHVRPRSQGGTHRLSNLVPACMPCNLAKNDRTPGQWKRARIAKGQPWPPLPRTAEDADPS